MADSSEVVSFEFARSELVGVLEESVRRIASGRPLGYDESRLVALNAKRFLNSCHNEQGMWEQLQRLAALSEAVTFKSDSRPESWGTIPLKSLLVNYKATDTLGDVPERDELLTSEIVGCKILADADHRTVKQLASTWNHKLGRSQLGLMLAAVNRLNDFRQRVFGLVSETPKQVEALLTGIPGYLDLIVDTERQIVRRVGADISVDLSRKPMVWGLFIALLRAAGTELGVERVRELPGESGNARSKVKASLNDQLQPLSVVITGSRSEKWRLVEET